MPRKSPKDSAATRDSMKTLMRESDEEIIERLRKDAIKAIRRLNPEPLPQAPWELWPGENTDLGGFLLAQNIKKKNQGGLA